MKTDKKEVIRFVDLFAGMGGMRVGFENALKQNNLTGKCVFTSEIKNHAINCYVQNFLGEKIYGDITKINEKDIPDFDVLLAGFPCQAFSSAGKRLGFEDTRGTLFFDVARIIKQKNPKGFLLENVEGLVTHDNGKTLTVILNTLKDLGYYVSYKVLNGKDFGLAQSRKRIYITGSKKSKVNLDGFPIKNNNLLSIIDFNVLAKQSKFTKKLLSHYKLHELPGKQIRDKRGGSNNIHSWDFNLKGKVNKEQKKLLELLLKQRRNKKWASIIGIDWTDGMPLTINMIETFYKNKNLKNMLDDLVLKGYLVYEYPKKKTSAGRTYDETLNKGYNIVTGKLSFEFTKILNSNDIAPTLTATDTSRLAVIVKDGIRSLTVKECLLLFGFPASYKTEGIPKNKIYDLIGNTVCVSVVEKIAIRLLGSFEK